MTISFSGLASGMDTSSWVEALVSVKQAEMTKLETKKSTIAASQETLNSIKNYFNSFRSLLENVTDSRFGITTTNLFAQNLAESSNVSVLSAVASTAAENTTYNIEVNQLASATEVNSGIKTDVVDSETDTATLDSKLFTLGDVTAGTITFKMDGYSRSIDIDENSTIRTFLNSLDSIGISASYNEDNGVFSINIGMSAQSGTYYVESDTSGIMDTLNLSDVNYGYQSGLINITTVSVTPGMATLTSTFEELGLRDDNLCKFEIVQKTQNNGTVLVTGTVTVSDMTTQSTVSDLFQLLSTSYGIEGTVNSDGVITLSSDKFGNVFQGTLAEALGFGAVEDPFISQTKMTSTAIVYSTKDTVVNRSSTLAQIGAWTGAGDTLIIRNCDGGSVDKTITSLNGNSTVQDLFNVLANEGITATINDGVITLNSTAGKFIDGNIATNIGIMQPVMDTYYTTAPMTMTSTSAFDTSKTLGALGMSSDGSVVIYSPVYGIVSVNIAKELTVQGFCNKINDSNYGIRASISGGKVVLSELQGSGAYVKGLSTVLQNALKLNVGEDYSYNTTTIKVYSNTDSGYLEYGDTGVEINGNTKISTINGYNHGNGTILLHRNGVVSTITVDSTLTLDEFINNPIVGLAQYDLTGNILSDGKAYLNADSDIYLEEIAGGSQILTALKMSPVQKTTSGANVISTSERPATVVVTTTAPAVLNDKLNMLNTTVDRNGTTVSLKTEGTLVFKLNDYYKTVNLTSDDTFSSLIDKLKAVGINSYLTRGQFYISSGFDNVEYVSDKNESTSDFMELVNISGPENLGGYSASSSPVKSTVTSTHEEVLSASNYAGSDTLLSDLSISAGSLTIYRNGQRQVIHIDDDFTFDRLQQELATKFGDLRIDFDDDGYLRNGKLRIYSTSEEDVSLSIGSTSDKSNFVAITGITGNQTNSLESSRQLYKVNDKSTVVGSGLFRELGKNGSVTTGSFRVGDADIYVQENTTISDIVSQINASERSLATAYWDNIEGKLVIKSSVTGASAVNIEAGDTNFTDVLGLTKDGSLVMDTQKIGSNAIVTINGTRYTSLSNNVTDESTGLTGLTINLKGLTNGSAVQLTVKRDTETLTNAVSNILDGYNELISNIDTTIAKDGKLKDQSMLKLIRNSIRTAMTSSTKGTKVFKNLASIGIKSSAVGSNNLSVENSDITFLSLDADEFLSALEGNEDDVRMLLLGTNDPNDFNGILVKVEKIIEDALTAKGGYFVTASNSYAQDYDNATRKIVNGTAMIEKYRKSLEKKFSSMDIMIAGMQNQFKSFLT